MSLANLNVKTDYYELSLTKIGKDIVMANNSQSVKYVRIASNNHAWLHRCVNKYITVNIRHVTLHEIIRHEISHTK